MLSACFFPNTRHLATAVAATTAARPPSSALDARPVAAIRGTSNALYRASRACMTRAETCGVGGQRGAHGGAQRRRYAAASISSTPALIPAVLLVLTALALSMSPTKNTSLTSDNPTSPRLRRPSATPVNNTLRRLVAPTSPHLRCSRAAPHAHRANRQRHVRSRRQ